MIKQGFSGRDLSSISTIILRDMLIDFHDGYGLSKGEPCEMARNSSSGNYLTYHDSLGPVMYCIVPSMPLKSDVRRVHGKTHHFKKMSEELNARIGYVFVTTFEDDPRMVHYAIVRPQDLDVYQRIDALREGSSSTSMLMSVARSATAMIDREADLYFTIAL